MKPKIMYEASDGKSFDTEAECVAYETGTLLPCIRIDALLPRRSLDAGQYYQHNHDDVVSFRRCLWRLVQAKYAIGFPHWADKCAEDIHPRSIVGRVLSDAGGPLNGLWYRLMCIDLDTAREYQQPYYANHPDEATQRVE